MATTENLHNGTGSQVDFSFTFPYLKTTDIKVAVDNVDKTLTTHYTLHNATTIRFVSAPASGTNNVKIYRDTASENLAATFYPGSAIRSSDLNDNYNQNLYVTQEAENDADTALSNSRVLESGSYVSAISKATTADTNATVAKRATDRLVATTSNDGVSWTLTGNNTNASTDPKGVGYAVTKAETAIADSATAVANAAAAVVTANNASGAVGDKIDQDGTVAMEANLAMGSNRITGVTDPSGAQDAATKNYVDTNHYTKTAADARFYNLASAEEIQSGETWSAADNLVATTAAIDARITDLVDDVGGFVPIANETSFPNTNPDVNNGAGTLVSIKALSSSITSNGSGVATIANGTVGNSTVTIEGLANSTTYAATYGMIVETTTTLNTYTFHRQTPKATEVTTVAGSITNVNTVAGSISNVNNVATNIADANAYGSQYQIASSDPSTDGGGASLAAGDLYYNTASNSLKVYTGSAWVAAGSGNILETTGGTLTGDLVIDNQKDLRLEEATANGNHYAAIQAPASLAANYTLTLPTTDGDVNQVLSTDGSGVLSWADSSAGATGAGTDEVFVENSQTVTGSYSLSTNKNAHLVGPVALNSGVVVTVPANATLLVH